MDSHEDLIIQEIFQELSWDLQQSSDPPVLDVTDMFNFVSGDSQSGSCSDFEQLLSEPSVELISSPTSGTSETSPTINVPVEKCSLVEPQKSIEVQLTCLVCGNVAGKHCYYGGQVCVSCRAFFRRSVLGKSYADFRCAKEKQCAINSKSWKSCRFCRFQKCLQSGMRIAWVDTEDRPKRALKSSTAKSKVVVPSHGVPQSLEPKWTVDEECYIRGFYTHAWENWCHVITDFYAKHPIYFASIVSIIFLDVSVDSNPLMKKANFYEGMIEMELSLQKFWFTHPDMNGLCKEDQEELVNKNNDLIFTFCRCVQYLNVQDVVKYSRLYRDHLKERANEDESCQDVAAMFKGFSISDHPEDYIKPNNTTPLCLLSNDTESKHVEDSIMTDMQEWSRLFAQGPCDPILQTLMGYILIFDPSMKKLQNYNAVSNIQTKYLHLLLRYLRAVVPKQANKKIGQAVEFLTKLRTLSDIQSQARSECINLK
ncbi:hypothetical protein TCAL_14607 [Tigriopus californicus]|uniref:Nuclear receptor domain-containing protein n=2 Tax=Tigriopus californicus TaxID=6832 RepID=A0A553PDC5_TIGCA|nr:hypothetical protein TCAL_14607 [Tigriopus californicus]